MTGAEIVLAIYVVALLSFLGWLVHCVTRQ